MKRYIRTKDGKIYDVEKLNVGFSTFYDDKDNCFGADDVAKQADTIEELFMISDLVINDKNVSCILHNQETIDIVKKLAIGSITELYTKQGRNYVLVAEKVNGKWRTR